MGEAIVTVEIVSCQLPEIVLEKNSISYEIKTFWCGVRQISSNRSGSSHLIKLPGLTKEAYKQKVRDEEKIVICIEVSSSASGLSELCGFGINTNYHMGVVICDIKDLLRKNSSSPTLQLLPIQNIVKGTTEGNLYVKVEARFNDSDDSTQTDFYSNHPTGHLSAQLIDHITGITHPNDKQDGRSEEGHDRSHFKTPGPEESHERRHFRASVDGRPDETHERRHFMTSEDDRPVEIHGRRHFHTGQRRSNQ